MSRAQDAHDCRDAGGRATQEQLPRSDWFSFALLLKLKARAYMDDEMNTSCIYRRRNAPLLRFLHPITNKRCSNESYTNRYRFGKVYFSGMRC
jgi:hypothetical protein